MYSVCMQYRVLLLISLYRDRPAANPVNVKSIADTSNFDDFPEIERNGRLCDLSS